MTNTFAHWPFPALPIVEFTAVCPCGASALWEQRGGSDGPWYRITCRRCAPR